MNIQLGPKSGTRAWIKGSVDAMIILRLYGLEVPINFTRPDVEYLEDTMPRFPRFHDRYYDEGGTHWPFRGVWA